MYDYYDSAADTTITASRARHEIEENHGMTDGMDEFIADCGDKPEYSAQSVLDWLGY